MTEHDIIVSQFKNKNEKAFEQLYNIYATSIQDIIFRIVKNQNIADELIQDVFLKAWKNADTYSSEKGRFFTWILNIARHTAIDKIRSTSYKNSKPDRTQKLYDYMVGSHNDLDHKTDAIDVCNFLDLLPSNRSEIIDLLFLQGFTHKEASKHLGIPLGTVKTRSRNGILQLRALIDKKNTHFPVGVSN